jgi:signal transduction histidine kinase
MELLAGIHLGWSIVYSILALSMFAVWLRFGRRKEYLLFGILCLELVVFSVARSVFYYHGGSADFVIAGRLTVAMLPLAAVTMLIVAGWNARLKGRTWNIASCIIHGLGLLCFVAAMTGWSLDYSHVHENTISGFGIEGVLREFTLTPLGIACSIYVLILALAGMVILFYSYANDRFMQVFFVLSCVLLGGCTVNDILLQAGLIPSLYLVEHGIFVVILGAFTGFLRQFEQSRKELERANITLAKMAGDLSDSVTRLDRITDETRLLRPMADLGRLSASLAHEIRNPLAVLSNVAATLRRYRTDRVDSEEYAALVEMLQEETNRLARLVDDLLLFSQSGRLSREPVDPRTLVELAVSEVAKVYPERAGYHIDVRIDAEIPLIPGSMDSLRRALVNLLVNAMQSSNGGGRVTIEARRGGDSGEVLLIGVQDEAGGIPKSDISEIFEPFYSTRPTGTGLGLPIVKSIVEAHEGDITVENFPGVGVTFWISLPLVTFHGPP